MGNDEDDCSDSIVGGCHGDARRMCVRQQPASHAGKHCPHPAGVTATGRLGRLRARGGWRSSAAGLHYRTKRRYRFGLSRSRRIRPPRRRFQFRLNPPRRRRAGLPCHSPCRPNRLRVRPNLATKWRCPSARGTEFRSPALCLAATSSRRPSARSVRVPCRFPWRWRTHPCRLCPRG